VAPGVVPERLQQHQPLGRVELNPGQPLAHLERELVVHLSPVTGFRRNRARGVEKLT